MSERLVLLRSLVVKQMETLFTVNSGVSKQLPREKSKDS